jgi:adenylate cyclase
MRAFEPRRADQSGNDATKGYLAAFAKLEANDPGAITALAQPVHGSRCSEGKR